MAKTANTMQDVFKHIDMHDGDDTVCWEWTRPITGERPYFTVRGEKLLAYRIVFNLVYGKLQDTDLVRHSCDNSICCNPKHLGKGSHEENMQDVRSRDRHGLPAHVVRIIRKLLSENRAQAEIADLYGISVKTVSAINTGRTKGYVTED